MNKICTSLEQSKKLIELGIDVSTADMFYADLLVDGNHKYNLHPLESYGFKTFEETKLKVSEHLDFIPAWSLSALLELMPPYLFEFERGIDLNIYPNLSGKAWHCSYMPNAVENMKNDKFKQITNGDNLVDAAFEMVVWLKENKKL